MSLFPHRVFNFFLPNLLYEEEKFEPKRTLSLFWLCAEERKKTNYFYWFCLIYEPLFVIREKEILPMWVSVYVSVCYKSSCTLNFFRDLKCRKLNNQRDTRLQCFKLFNVGNHRKMIMNSTRAVNTRCLSSFDSCLKFTKQLVRKFTDFSKRIVLWEFHHASKIGCFKFEEVYVAKIFKENRKRFVLK